MIIVKPSKDILQLNKGFRFERNSTAFDEEGNLFLPHNARFLQGKFGKGIFIEEGTVNSWTENRLLGYKSLLKPMPGEKILGRSAYLNTPTMPETDNNFGIYLSGSIALDSNIQGFTVTIPYHIIYYETTAPRRLRYYARVIYEDSTMSNIEAIIPDTNDPNNWGQDLLVKQIVPNDGDKKMITISAIYFYSDYVTADTKVIFGRPQLELKPYVTSFTLSVRSPETVTIPVNTISPTGGQWDHYAYINSMARRQVAGQTPTLFHIPRQDGGMGIRVCHAEDSANWKLQTMDDTNNITEAEAPDTLTPDGWHRFTVKWTEAEAKLLIDGVVAGTIANPALPSVFASEAFIGSYDGQKDFLNTLHDDIRVSSIARDDADDLADYQADQPLPTDQYTIYKQSFDSPNDMYVRQGFVL